jgi:ATP/maltotriose-dependent transcriptional regulator MalT
VDAEQVRGLVGRTHEVAALETALDRLAAGKPWLLEIVGEPGIGKSRLLAELCRRGEDRGYLVLDGRADEFERDIPFGLIVDGLNDYLGSLEPAFLHALDEDLLRELTTVFPALPREYRGAASRAEGAERYRLHYAVRSLLERLAGRQPLVLALDDVHWADAASIEMLAHLLRRFRGPLLMAATCRQAPTRLLVGLEGRSRAGHGSRVELAPLTATETAELLGPQVDDATRSWLYRESGGNPFYIEQLARAGHAPGRASWSATRPGETVPRAVIVAIREELTAVSEEARLALEAAAVAGDPFDPELIGAVAEQTLASVLVALDELLSFDFIRPTDTPRRFRFRHPIVRRAVYDGMPAGWRIGAHGRAAGALAARDSPAGVRAHHIEHSAVLGDEEAIQLLVQAGRDAAPRAPETAGRWLLAATRLLAPSRANERRLSLLSEAAAALTYAGNYDAALEVLEQAHGLLPVERAGERAKLVTRISFAKRMSGRPFESRLLVERTLESLAAGGPEAMALTLELALDHYWRGEFARMHEVGRGVLELARATTEPLFVTWSAAVCSVASSSLGRLDAGRAELREAQERFAALDDEQLATHIDVAGYLAQAASALELIDDMLAHARRGLQVAESTGQRAFIPGLLVLETNALLMKGRITEAVATADTATDAACLTGNDQLTVWALWADALACSVAGDTARALASAREAVACSERVTETFFSTLSRLHLAAALDAAGDAEAARVELTAFEAGPDQRLLDLRGGHGWELLIRTQLSLGDVDAATESAATAEARAKATSLTQRTATAVCARGAVRLARDDPRGAIRAAREALAIADAAGNPVLLARARALIGAGLARSGESAAGISELEAAERILYAAGAMREAEAAARELRRLGRRGPRRAPTPSGGKAVALLSPREREVATLVATGKRNRDVAAALFVSEKTVESHLARIYDKLGVRSRAALATIMAAGPEFGETQPLVRTRPSV